MADTAAAASSPATLDEVLSKATMAASHTQLLTHFGYDDFVIDGDSLLLYIWRSVGAARHHESPEEQVLPTLFGVERFLSRIIDVGGKFTLVFDEKSVAGFHGALRLARSLAVRLLRAAPAIKAAKNVYVTAQSFNTPTEFADFVTERQRPAFLMAALDDWQAAGPSVVSPWLARRKCLMVLLNMCRGLPLAMMAVVPRMAGGTLPFVDGKLAESFERGDEVTPEQVAAPQGRAGSIQFHRHRMLTFVADGIFDGALREQAKALVAAAEAEGDDADAAQAAARAAQPADPSQPQAGIAAALGAAAASALGAGVASPAAVAQAARAATLACALALNPAFSLRHRAVVLPREGPPADSELGQALVAALALSGRLAEALASALPPVATGVAEEDEEEAAATGAAAAQIDPSQLHAAMAAVADSRLVKSILLLLAERGAAPVAGDDATAASALLGGEGALAGQAGPVAAAIWAAAKPAWAGTPLAAATLSEAPAAVAAADSQWAKAAMGGARSLAVAARERMQAPSALSDLSGLEFLADARVAEPLAELERAEWRGRAAPQLALTGCVDSGAAAAAAGAGDSPTPGLAGLLPAWLAADTASAEQEEAVVAAGVARKGDAVVQGMVHRFVGQNPWPEHHLETHDPSMPQEGEQAKEEEAPKSIKEQVAERKRRRREQYMLNKLGEKGMERRQQQRQATLNMRITRMLRADSVRQPKTIQSVELTGRHGAAAAAGAGAAGGRGDAAASASAGRSIRALEQAVTNTVENLFKAESDAIEQIVPDTWPASRLEAEKKAGEVEKHRQALEAEFPELVRTIKSRFTGARGRNDRIQFLGKAQAAALALGSTPLATMRIVAQNVLTIDKALRSELSETAREVRQREQAGDAEAAAAAAAADVAGGTADFNKPGDYGVADVRLWTPNARRQAAALLRLRNKLVATMEKVRGIRANFAKWWGEIHKVAAKGKDKLPELVEGGRAKFPESDLWETRFDDAPEELNGDVKKAWDLCHALPIQPLDAFAAGDEGRSPDSTKLSEPRFQMQAMAQALQRPKGVPDPQRRVQFTPDKWQLDLLNAVDKEQSCLIVAPTSSGKTFISLYAMEKVLRADDDGVVLYVAPSRALADQTYGDVEYAYQKVYSTSRSHVGRYHFGKEDDVVNCQALMTTVECAEHLVTSPYNLPLRRRIKWVILDEIHNALEHPAWERIIMSLNAPFLALSATVGDHRAFQSWLEGVQVARGFTGGLHTIVHKHRWNDLFPMIYHRPVGEVTESVQAVVEGVTFGVQDAAKSTDEALERVEAAAGTRDRAAHLAGPPGAERGAAGLAGREVAEGLLQLRAAGGGKAAEGDQKRILDLPAVAMLTADKLRSGVPPGLHLLPEDAVQLYQVALRHAVAALVPGTRAEPEEGDAPGAVRIVPDALGQLELSEEQRAFSAARARGGEEAERSPAPLTPEPHGEPSPAWAANFVLELAPETYGFADPGQVRLLDSHAYGKALVLGLHRRLVRDPHVWGPIVDGALAEMRGRVEEFSHRVDDDIILAGGADRYTRHAVIDMAYSLRDQKRLPALAFNLDRDNNRRLLTMLVDYIEAANQPHVESKRRQLRESAAGRDWQTTPGNKHYWELTEDEIDDEIEQLERRKKELQATGTTDGEGQRAEEARAEMQDMDDRLKGLESLLTVDSRLLFTPTRLPIPYSTIAELVGLRGKRANRKVVRTRTRRRALHYGIGMHNRGVNARYRHAVEALFNEKRVQLVISTDTLAQGINMPAKTAVMLGDSPALHAALFRQMSGRAGRRGRDKRGYIIWTGVPYAKMVKLSNSVVPEIQGHGPADPAALLRAAWSLGAAGRGRENADIADLVRRSVKAMVTSGMAAGFEFGGAVSTADAVAGVPPRLDNQEPAILPSEQRRAAVRRLYALQGRFAAAVLVQLGFLRPDGAVTPMGVLAGFLTSRLGGAAAMALAHAVATGALDYLVRIAASTGRKFAESLSVGAQLQAREATRVMDSIIAAGVASLVAPKPASPASVRAIQARNAAAKHPLALARTYGQGVTAAVQLPSVAGVLQQMRAQSLTLLEAHVRAFARGSGAAEAAEAALPLSGLAFPAAAVVPAEVVDEKKDEELRAAADERDAAAAAGKAAEEAEASAAQAAAPAPAAAAGGDDDGDDWEDMAEDEPAAAPAPAPADDGDGDDWEDMAEDEPAAAPAAAPADDGDDDDWEDMAEDEPAAAPAPAPADDGDDDDWEDMADDKPAAAAPAAAAPAAVEEAEEDSPDWDELAGPVPMSPSPAIAYEPPTEQVAAKSPSLLEGMSSLVLPFAAASPLVACRPGQAEAAAVAAQASSRGNDSGCVEGFEDGDDLAEAVMDAVLVDPGLLPGRSHATWPCNAAASDFALHQSRAAVGDQVVPGNAIDSTAIYNLLSDSKDLLLAVADALEVAMGVADEMPGLSRTSFVLLHQTAQRLALQFQGAYSRTSS